MYRSCAVAVCVLLASVSVRAQAPGQVRRASKPSHGKYIVVLNPLEDPESVGRETAALHRGRLRHIYRAALKGFAVELPDAAAQALARDPRVRFVEEDAIVSVTDTQSGAPWGLDRIDQRSRARDGQYSYPESTNPVHVYVLDTGVRITHVEFGGRASLVADHVDDDLDGDPSDLGNDDGSPVPDGADCNGHGTHVAATIAGETYGVAKQATIWSHRVLDCSGQGLLSGVIAAVDDVTANHESPAVANMSLGGGPSGALDEAVQRSIASGVTYVVAAGNDNQDASTSSPARVPSAITVGATTSSDARASYSNYGPVLDLFAPGSSITAAWFTSDVDLATISGTSMATPHVAGVAALYLQQHPSDSPAAVRTALVAAATPSVVSSAGAGSPNLLLYSAFLLTPAPSVTLVSPNGGERLFAGTPYTIAWTSTATAGVTFDVERSLDGVNYAAVAGCTGLAAAARTCVWPSPGPAASKTWLRVRAINGAVSGSDASDAPFQIVAGAATVTLKTPSTTVNWARGSTQTIQWTHNLGINSSVRLELSRDGGATYSETIAANVKHTLATSGSYEWTVTGPLSATARVRATWTGGAASDVSDVAFTIAEPSITAGAAPKQGWGYGTVQRQTWSSNLGPGDRVRVELSTDGGATYPIVLASNLSAGAKKANIVVPTLASPTAAARVRVVWQNGTGEEHAGVQKAAGFRIEPPFIRITSPNGGDAWMVNQSAKVTWVSNLGAQENVAVQLSTDGGGGFGTTVAASTASDGSLPVSNVPAAWTSSSALVRVVWLKNTTVADRSDAVFTIR